MCIIMYTGFISEMTAMMTTLTTTVTLVTILDDDVQQLLHTIGQCNAEPRLIEANAYKCVPHAHSRIDPQKA